MVSIKFLFFLALAIACVVAEETVREKKQVLLGGYPYAYSAGIVPTAYSAGVYPYNGLYGSYFI
ncbi:hypothetical protein O3M35_009972 [Rhynocoris fuscipes]|uniref:Uncharacterized protein n=1 Tax=Rhynocoris fuscipes TaxID=488301 RepID=A0AAW1CYP5_9HEMI